MHNVALLQEAVLDRLEASNVERDARRRLEASAYVFLKTVKCRYRHGALVLTGRVPRYFHKQLAQEAVRALPGVAEIVNRISVDQPLDRFGTCPFAETMPNPKPKPK